MQHIICHVQSFSLCKGTPVVKSTWESPGCCIFEKKTTKAKFGVPSIVNILPQKNSQKRGASKIIFAFLPMNV